MRNPDRASVYDAIDNERDYQDARRGNSARTQVDDNRDLGSLILLTEHYLDKAKAGFAGPHPQGAIDALDNMRKVVALGVLAMERHGIIIRHPK